MIPKKRFWKQASVFKLENGFEVQLDGRPLRTPAKTPIVLPNVELATLLAEEWDGVEEQINPTQMPATRMTNSAIDTVTVRKEDIVSMLADYAKSDLLCYWAEGPSALVDQQRRAWEPVVDWISQRHATKISVTSGVMPVLQEERLRRSVGEELAGLEPFDLAGMHDLTVLSGSVFLALAWHAGRLDTDQAWSASRIDAEWQISLWGEDEDEARVTALKRADFHFAAKFCRLAQITA